MAGQIAKKIFVLLLTMIAHSQGQVCSPGVRTLYCISPTAHNWVGSALTGQCPENNDEIAVNSIGGMVGDTFSCGIFTVMIIAIHPGTRMGTIDLNSSISFTATADLAGTEVVCENTAETEVVAFTIRGVDSFPTDAKDVNVSGLPTYVVTDMSTAIEVPIQIADEVLSLFPGAYISVSYSGFQLGCGGISRVMNNAAQVDIGCLEETNVNFTAVLMEDDECRSNSTNLPPQSFPLIAEPDFEVTITMTSNTAELSVSMANVVPLVRVQDDSFGVVGTATADNGCTEATSAPPTYPTAVFSNLQSSTSYSFTIQIVSRASDHTVIGRFSGRFTTLPPSNAGLSTAEAVGISITVSSIVAFIVGLVVGWCVHQ